MNIEARRAKVRRVPRGGRSKKQAGETKVLGANAVRALITSRIDDVIRVLLVEERVRDFRDLLRWCAAEKRAYRVVSSEELDRFAGSLHHEGICVLARERAPVALEDVLDWLAGEAGPLAVVILDGVQNPNNAGAILRSCAFFGAPFVIALGEAPKSSALARTAEGAAEVVELVATDLPPKSLFNELRKTGLKIVATAADARDSIFSPVLPARMALVLGAEDRGLSRAARQNADQTRAIPGTGDVESLNVSVACGIILAEHWRQHS